MNANTPLPALSPEATRAEVLAFLAALPAESDRQFETALTDLVVTKPGLISILRDISSDRSQPHNLRYAAFFAVGTHARRRKDVSVLMKLLVANEDDFGAFGTFEHLYSMALRLRSGPGDAIASLERARLAKSRLPDHAGVLHAFAETAIAGFEEGDNFSDKSSLMTEVEISLERALSLETTYARFYCTKGRLEALRGHHGEARALIRRAIDSENSIESDYWGRLADYQAHLLHIRIRETSQRAVREIDEKMRQLQTEFQRVSEETKQHVTAFNASLKEMQARHLEFLGFFTAILALIISSIQLANRPAMREVMATLLMLGGILITAFAALGLLIRDSVGRSLVVFLIGMAMCGAAFVLWQLV